MDYLYHIRGPKRAVLFLQDLYKELIGIVLEIRVIFLLDNGDSRLTVVAGFDG
jgi:hypothetical protein